MQSRRCFGESVKGVTRSPFSPQMCLFDTLKHVKGIQDTAMAAEQAAALVFVTNQLAYHHLYDSNELLSKSTLATGQSLLSTSSHDFHSALTALSHQNSLSHMAAHDRASSSLQAFVDSTRDATSNSKAELCMLWAAGKAEMRGEAATIEMAIAKEEAALATAVGEVKTRLEKVKIAFIAAFIGAMVSCFAMITWKVNGE